MAELIRVTRSETCYVWKCSECGAWAYGGTGELVMHDKRRCDYFTLQPTEHVENIETRVLKQRATVLRSLGITLAKPVDEATQMRRLAKAGTLYSKYTSEQVAAAVKAGWISASDAMNQDM